VQLGGGILYDLSKKAMLTKNYKELDDTIRQRLPPYLYNKGKGILFFDVTGIEPLQINVSFFKLVLKKYKNPVENNLTRVPQKFITKTCKHISIPKN
jgi:hypothetical protein